MKRVFFAMALLIGSLSVQAQSAPDNQPVTREVTVDTFSVLDLDGSCNVYLTQGNQVSVKVEADADLQDKVMIEAKGGTLFVSTNRSRKDRKKKVNVYITFVEVTDINSHFSGNLVATAPIKQRVLRYKSTAVGNTTLKLEVDDLWLKIAANGNTDLIGKSNNCELINNSIGFVKAGDLIVENLRLSTTATGSTEYYGNNVVIVKNMSIGGLVNKKKRLTGQ
jgi:hypothetical protein